MRYISKRVKDNINPFAAGEEGAYNLRMNFDSSSLTRVARQSLLCDMGPSWSLSASFSAG